MCVPYGATMVDSGGHYVKTDDLKKRRFDLALKTVTTSVPVVPPK